MEQTSNGLLSFIPNQSIRAPIAEAPEGDDVGRTKVLAQIAFVITMLQLVFLAAWHLGVLPMHRILPWLFALAVLLAGWEIITAKLDLFPRPFFVSPQAMMDVFIDDWPRLGESLLRSLWLLLPAYLIGAAAGLQIRVSIPNINSCSIHIVAVG